MTIFRGGFVAVGWREPLPVARTRLGERSAGPLVCLRMPGDLVASHLTWQRVAEFHFCAPAAAPMGCEGVCFMLRAGRMHSNGRRGFRSPKSWSNGEIAAGATRRLRRVGAVGGNCARPTRPHVTRRGHFTGCLAPAPSFQPSPLQTELRQDLNMPQAREAHAGDEEREGRSLASALGSRSKTCLEAQRPPPAGRSPLRRPRVPVLLMVSSAVKVAS